MVKGSKAGKGHEVTTRYFLSFMGTTAPQQAIDPATFPVIIRYELQQPEGHAPLSYWLTTNENGRGTVTDSRSAVYGDDSLDGVVSMLAAAGFKRVAVDMASVPFTELAGAGADDTIPF